MTGRSLQSARLRRLTGGILVFLLLVALKLWLVAFQDLMAIGEANHDDRGFLDAAVHLASGDWLGPYDPKTLIKGPFYPLWIASTFTAGLPLLLAEHLLYLLACGVFVAAVEPLYARRRRDPHRHGARPHRVLSGVLWVVLACNPMSFTDGPMTRVTREGIYPALTLLVLAGAVGLLARRERPPVRRLGWAVLLGLSLAAFWLTREEGVWLLPSVVLLTACALPGRGPGRRRRASGVALLLLPFLLAGLAVGGVAALNRLHYGAAVVVEILSAPFEAAYGALGRVGGEHFESRVPVPKAARLALYEESPAFAELRPLLEGRLGRRWIGTSCRQSGVCDDIGGGWFLWAFREAAAKAGHHESLPEALAYYRRLAEEVNRACEEDRLRCAPPRSSLRPVWNPAYREPFVAALDEGLSILLRFRGFEARPGRSAGSRASLELFRTVTHEHLAPVKRRQLELAGWVMSPGERVRLEVRSWTGARDAADIGFRESKSAREFFRRRGEELVQPARFTVRTTCTEGCTLRISAAGRLLAEIPVDGWPREIDRPDLYLNLWAAPGMEGPPVVASRLRDFKAGVLEGVAASYRQVVPGLAVVALLVYLGMGVSLLRNRRRAALFLVATALLGALAARLVLLALIDATSYPAVHRGYLSPAFPLLLALLVLLSAEGVRGLARVVARGLPMRFGGG